MTLTRVIASAALAVAIPTIITTVSASADTWPSRPIRIVVGFGAGGGTDIAARIVAQPLSDKLGQPVVVENKPGAGGTIASNQVAHADKNGYTALVISTGHTVSAAMFKSLPYDSVKDFAPVGLVANSSYVVVARGDLPVNNLRDLIALAKAKPGDLKFASVGVGSTQHLAGELLHQKAGMKVLNVPYRGTPALVTALIAGEVDYGVELLHAVKGNAEAGKLKILAVASPERSPAAPDIPTVAEQGVPGYAAVAWYGMVYPAGTPADVVSKTSAALRDILGRKEIQAQLEKIGASAKSSTPEEFGKLLSSEVETWKAVREAAGIEQK
jgi:tripartite-type tricarboxylate transporter receptor subunit TctC